jgi:general secretion pathway protein A
VLFRLTKGVPRLINLICHQSLLAAYSLGVKNVSPDLVKDASVEILSGLDNGKPNRSNNPLKAGLLVVSILLSVFVFLPRNTIDSWRELIAINESTNYDDLLIIEDLATDLVEQNISPLTATEEEMIDLVFTDTSNPLVNLLAAWSIESSEVYSTEVFSGIAATFGLQSENVTKAAPWILNAIDRPGLVVLDEGDGLPKSYLLAQLNEDSVTLITKDGEIYFDLEQFLNRWTGSFLYLWRPHKGIDLLMQGDIDKLAMHWLQEKLSLGGDGIEKVITGGRYTEAVKDQVIEFQRRHNLDADGIVGRQTLMRLNELFDDEIPRLRGIAN